MASPGSIAASEDASSKPVEQITFRFCSECSNMLYPKEDQENNRLQFTCRTCHYTEEATSTCVFRNVMNTSAGETAGVTQDVGSDPTVGNFRTGLPELCFFCDTVLRCNVCDEPSDAFFVTPVRIVDPDEPDFMDLDEGDEEVADFCALGLYLDIDEDFGLDDLDESSGGDQNATSLRSRRLGANMPTDISHTLKLSITNALMPRISKGMLRFEQQPILPSPTFSDSTEAADSTTSSEATAYSSSSDPEMSDCGAASS